MYTDATWIAKEEQPSDLVPQTTYENIRFRQRMVRWSKASPENRQTIICACSRDLLFFINTFVWVQDVRRHPEQPNRPFIAWEAQREILLDLDAAIGHRDLGLIKSRDVGGSTCPLIVFDRRLLFFPDQTLMVMSRNEKWVDDPRNPDSCFYKLDYMHRWLPSWMTAPLERTSLNFTHLRSRSNIIGSSTTGDAGRGGRKHAVLLDEYGAFDRAMSFDVLAALQHNTRCQIYASTPHGVGNGFHQVITADNIRVHRLHWSQHPVHGLGTYDTREGKLHLVDKEFWRTAIVADVLDRYPELEKHIEAEPHERAREHYHFILDGKLRSPYYDHACLKCPIPKLIAQELDMEFVGSGSPFFDVDELHKYVASIARAPFHVGELSFEAEDPAVKWAESDKGRLQLWFHPNMNGHPPSDRRYVIGCDISQGTGVSNSVISVGDCRSRSKIAALATPDMRPERFAELVAAVGRWFHDAEIIFEGSGPGSDFGARLKELAYSNLYYQKTAAASRARKPGWFSNADLKRNLLTEYGRALSMSEFTNYDEVAVNECQCYEFTDDQRIEHTGARGSPDPSGAKKNHGDRVIADALDWMLMCRTRPPAGEAMMSRRERIDAMQRQIELDEARGDEWCACPHEEPWCEVGV